MPTSHPTSHPMYRALLRLYPREFRLHYGDDLVQTFHDILTDRGARTACTRTGLDLILTVPRYHLERIMTEDRSNTTLSISIALLAAGGVAVTFLGALPGIALIAVAAIFAIAQRSHLARALHVSNSNSNSIRRRQRFLISAVLAASAVVSFRAFVGDPAPWAAKDTVLYIIFHAALVGTPAFFIAGLLTFRRPTGVTGSATGTLQ